MGALGCSVDWLGFTLPVGDLTSLVDVVEDVCEWFGGGAVDMDRGRLGYSHGRMILGTGTVLWCPDRLEMGVHVELPSKALGLADLEVGDLLTRCLARGGHFSRVDVALDTNAVTVAQIVEMNADGRLISKTENRLLIHDLKTGGQTLYIGSARSRRRVRCYDKAAEQGDESGGIWTRIEVQFRDDYAQQAAVYILAGHALEDLIVSSVDFRDHDDSNTTRRSRCSWWEEVLGAVQRIKFYGKPVQHSINDMLHWLNNQVAPTLAVLCIYFGNKSWLDWLIDNGAGRIKPWHVNLLSHST